MTSSVAQQTPAADTLQSFVDGRWGHVRVHVRDCLHDPVFRPQPGLPLDEHRERTLAQARALADASIPQLLFPRAVGGGDDIGGAVAALQVVAGVDLSLMVKTGVQWGLFGGALYHLGTQRHHERYLAPAISLELPGCFAMTETGHGSDVQALRTTATYDPETQEFVVHTPDEDAQKDYIGNAAAHGRAAVVFAQLRTRGEEQGVHAFVVPLRTDDGTVLPGVTVGDDGVKGGLGGVDNGRLSFDHVRIPREALLDRFASVAPDGTYTSPVASRNARFFSMLGTLVQGRVAVSGGALGATKTALTVATRYALARRQFFPPSGGTEVLLLDYRAHQRRLLPALATTYALHFAQEALTALLHEVFASEAADEHKRRELEAYAAGMKVLNTWHAIATIQTCREACGGAGYLAENRLVGLRADVDIFSTFEGDNTVLLQLVAKGLLTDYQQEFGSYDTLGMVRFVADRAVEAIVEHGAVRAIVQRLAHAAGRDEERDLLDPDYQSELVDWRARHVLEGLARRLRSGMKAGRDAFEVFNAAQDHMLLAARAHLDAWVLEQFRAAVARCPDAQVAALLGSVCDLYALALLEQERGWFIEHGRLAPPRTKAVTPLVNELCQSLRPVAGLLVDGLGVPEGLVGAPIATGDEDRRQRLRAAASSG